ncbi:MAG: STAS domain-containing protein [Bacteroidia bacterium]|nr:STAS domain-containing protein [Bacteroidia bacterium]
MKIVPEKTAEALVIHAEGRLDAISVGEFENEVNTLLLQSEQNVLIDFEKIDYISSAGMRFVLLLARELNSKNKILVLCNPNETIMEVFSLSGFDTIISIYPTISEGINSIKGK